MNAGGETADQAVRMTLQGIEMAANVALKAGGMASKSLAVTLYAILTDKKKVKGKTRLANMLKSGKELKVFAVHHSDLKKFCEEAKRYGVLYSVLKERNNTDGICDIMVRAEDAAKISRIVDKYELATIDTEAMRKAALAKQPDEFKDVKPLTEKEHDELVSSLLDSMKEEQNPSMARTKTRGENQFEHISMEDLRVRTAGGGDHAAVAVQQHELVFILIGKLLHHAPQRQTAAGSGALGGIAGIHFQLACHRGEPPVHDLLHAAVIAPGIAVQEHCLGQQHHQYGDKQVAPQPAAGDTASHNSVLLSVRFRTNPLRHRCAMPPPPKGGGFSQQPEGFLLFLIL